MSGESPLGLTRVICLVLENRGLTDPAEIEQALRFGEYIKNGAHIMTHLPSTSFDIFILLILCTYASPLCCTALHGKWAFIETLALYSLRKYRHLKRRYDTSNSDS